MVLLTPEKVREFMQLATNENDFKFQQCAKEAEEIDVKQVLGSSFWLFIKKNQTDSDIINLMDGSEYVDCNGETVEHCGLWSVISYYFMARWKIVNLTTDTQSGSLYSEPEYGQVPSRSQVGRIADDYRENGSAYFEQVLNFLRENESIYPLYKCRTSKPIGKGRITTF